MFDYFVTIVIMFENKIQQQSNEDLEEYAEDDSEIQKMVQKDNQTSWARTSR